ncbi:MAG: Rieske (2Fe-2S) protein [Nocardioidaceae bacterium]
MTPEPPHPHPLPGDQRAQDPPREHAALPGTLRRRQVLMAGAGAVGLLTVAACSGGGSPGDGAGDGGGGGGGGDAGGAPGTDTSTTGGATGSPGEELTTLADVPVGGAVSAQDADDHPLIVAQPTAGKAVAFSAICTHQGCTVAPQGKKLVCPCHGSVYDATTGENISGPAPAPLHPVAVQVIKGEVVSGEG